MASSFMTSMLLKAKEDEARDLAENGGAKTRDAGDEVDEKNGRERSTEDQSKGEVEAQD